MKSIQEMTGIEKSAMLLVALGAEVASRVLTYLDEKAVFKIAGEIAKINDISIKDKEELINAFLQDFKKNKNAVIGGENVAREMLIAAFGENTADNILNNITYIDIEKGFSFLKNIDPDILTSLLENEHPQTIAAALYYLAPEQNAKILKNLPPELSKNIIKRMAKLEKPAPKALIEIVRVLTAKYEKIRSSTLKLEKADGINSLIDIMDHMNPNLEKKLLNFFEARLPELSEKIKEKLFGFEAVLNLTNMEVQLLISEINDDYLIGKSLKGAGDEIRFKLLRNMSQNRAANILNDMDNLGSVRLAEINEAKNSIVRIMRILNDTGDIKIRKSIEKMVY